MTHIVVDPVTRIEGHLRIEAEVDGGRRSGRLVLFHDVPRYRDHLEGQGSARCLGLHPADLRCVHHRARHNLDPRGRERHRGGTTGKREIAAQSHHGLADGPGPRRPLLPSARPGLGGHRLGPVGRPGGYRCAGTIDLRLAAIERQLLHGCSGSCTAVRRAWPAGPVRQRLLGSPGLPAATRSQPDGGGPLSRGPRLAARFHQDPRRPRGQEPAPPELPGGWHGDPGRPRQTGFDQHDLDRLHAEADSPGQRPSWRRSTSRICWQWRLSTRIGPATARVSATTSSMASIPRRTAPTLRSSSPPE